MKASVSAMLDLLRAKGVAKATFVAGELASVEFGSLTPAAPADDQRDTTEEPSPRRMSATGGLVSRGDDSA